MHVLSNLFLYLKGIKTNDNTLLRARHRLQVDLSCFYGYSFSYLLMLVGFLSSSHS